MPLDTFSVDISGRNRFDDVTDLHFAPLGSSVLVTFKASDGSGVSIVTQETVVVQQMLKES